MYLTDNFHIHIFICVFFVDSSFLTLAHPSADYPFQVLVLALVGPE